jgi:hypothetical protein
MAFSNSTKYRFALIALLILAAFVMGSIRHHALAEQKERGSDLKCDIHQTACTNALPDCTVTLDIKPKPVKAMTDLTFEVILSGRKPIKNPYIDLGMPGMDMGPNRVTLQPAENNRYKGNGIIVRCPSGRRTWKVSVTLPDIGTTEYIFDVVD